MKTGRTKPKGNRKIGSIYAKKESKRLCCLKARVLGEAININI